MKKMDITIPLPTWRSLSIYFWLPLVVGLTILLGCKATLESGGAYAPLDTNGVAQVQPDLQFYQIDAAYDLSYSVIDAAFRFERDNRNYLWQISPEIKHTLDSIRPQAAQANIEYLTARAQYMRTPLPTGLTTLQTILAKIQQIAQAAQAALPATPAK